MRLVAACAAAVALVAAGCGGDGDEAQKTLDEQIQEGLTAAKEIREAAVYAATGLLDSHAFYCREPRRTREGQRTREECRHDLESTTQALLDSLEDFDDSFRREQIDGALATVKGLCDACERMLRDERP